MDGYTEFATALGKRVKESRKEAGMSQRALADRIGVTDRAVVNYEHGWRCMSAWTLLKICKVLGISADEMLGLRTEGER